jgi:hypothetical protein
MWMPPSIVVCADMRSGEDICRSHPSRCARRCVQPQGKLQSRSACVRTALCLERGQLSCLITACVFFYITSLLAHQSPPLLRLSVCLSVRSASIRCPGPYLLYTTVVRLWHILVCTSPQPMVAGWPSRGIGELRPITGANHRTGRLLQSAGPPPAWPAPIWEDGANCSRYS